jgi:hypothetical protein
MSSVARIHPVISFLAYLITPPRLQMAPAKMFPIPLYHDPSSVLAHSNV